MSYIRANTNPDSLFVIGIGHDQIAFHTPGEEQVLPGSAFHKVMLKFKNRHLHETIITCGITFKYVRKGRWALRYRTWETDKWIRAWQVTWEAIAATVKRREIAMQGIARVRESQKDEAGDWVVYIGDFMCCGHATKKAADFCADEYNEAILIRTREVETGEVNEE